MQDHRGQRHQHIRQNISHYDIITLVSYFILNLFVCNDIADHHLEFLRCDTVSFTVLSHCFHSTDIKISTHCMFCTEHQGQNRQNTASGTHIQKFCLRGDELAQLSDAQLSGLMHTGSKRSAGIDMKHHAVIILRCHVLPRRDYQNIINIELMEVLLPVIDPVDIFGLIHCDAAFSDIHEPAQFLQLLFHITNNGLYIRRLSLHFQGTVFFFFYKEA